MRKLFIFPLMAGIGLIAAALVFGGSNILYFADMPSLIICVVLPLIVMLSHSTFGEMGKAYMMAVQKGSFSITELKSGITVLKSLEKQIFLSGCGGTVYGVISMLTSHDIQTDMIGKGFSMALLTIFYMVIIIQFCVNPFKAGLEKKMALLTK